MRNRNFSLSHARHKTEKIFLCSITRLSYDGNYISLSLSSPWKKVGKLSIIFPGKNDKTKLLPNICSQPILYGEEIFALDVRKRY